MDTQKRKMHPLLILLIILFAILVLIAAFPFVYNLIAGFDSYDDVSDLASRDGKRVLSVDSSGAVGFSANKSAVYSYAVRNDAEERILDYVSMLPFCSEKTVSIKRFGYDLSEDSLSASVKLELFGFIPVQLHADSDIRLTSDKLKLKLSSLKYGSLISIPLDKYAEKYDIPELKDGFNIDLTDFCGELHPLEISANDNVIFIKSDIINKTAQRAGTYGVDLAVMTSALFAEDSDAAKVLRGDSPEVYAGIINSEDLSALLTGLIKFCPDTSADSLKKAVEDTPFLNLELGDVSVCTSAYSSLVNETLGDYEDRLTALRNNYKALNYYLNKDGFYNFDGTRVESALPEEWEARIVLQYNKDYASIVKQNDGSLVNGAWTELPNPKISEVKHNGRNSLPKVSGVSIFDLTLALRTPGGAPAVLFLTANDDLGLNFISEKKFKEIKSSAVLPVYCSSDIISPDEAEFVTPDEARRNLHCYFP